MDPDTFWRQTPRLFGLIIGAKGRILDRERRRDAWVVWHIAALQRLGKGKMPTLDQLAGVQSVAKKQTPAEMKAAFASVRLAMS